MKQRQMNSVWLRRIKGRSVLELVMAVGRWYPSRLSVRASDPMSQSSRPRGKGLLQSWGFSTSSVGVLRNSDRPRGRVMNLSCWLLGRIRDGRPEGVDASCKKDSCRVLICVEHFGESFHTKRREENMTEPRKCDEGKTSRIEMESWKAPPRREFAACRSRLPGADQADTNSKLNVWPKSHGPVLNSRFMCLRLELNGTSTMRTPGMEVI